MSKCPGLLYLAVLLLSSHSLAASAEVGAAGQAPTQENQPWAGGFQTPPSLLAYYGWLRSATEHKQLEQFYLVEWRVAQGGSARHKLMLALILSLPDTPFVDYTRARRLLYEYSRDLEFQNEEDRDLAQLVRDLLDELEWVNASSGRNKQSTIAMKDENTALQSKVGELNAEVARLEAQLEQLKQIEQTITETQRSVNIPAPAPTPAPENDDDQK